MDIKYKELFEYITTSQDNPYLKIVKSYKKLPYRNNFYLLLGLLDYYHVNTIGDLLNILSYEYNFGNISNYINESFYDRTLNSKINRYNYNRIVLNPMKDYLPEDKLLNLVNNLDKDKFRYLLQNKSSLNEDNKKILNEYIDLIGQYSEYLQNNNEIMIHQDLYSTFDWVSKDVGDGFGFDFIRKERNNNIVLIEVKGSLFRYPELSISQNEYDICKEATKINNTSYQINHYVSLCDNYDINSYVYDNKRDSFITDDIFCGFDYFEPIFKQSNSGGIYTLKLNEERKKIYEG